MAEKFELEARWVVHDEGSAVVEQAHRRLRNFAASTRSEFAVATREAAHSTAALTGSLVDQLNPALGAAVDRLSMASRVAAGLGPAIGGVAVAVAAGAIALGRHLEITGRLVEQQVALNEATRGFNTGALRGQLDEARRELERLEALGERQSWRKGLDNLVASGIPVLSDLARLFADGELAAGRYGEAVARFMASVPVERAQQLAEIFGQQQDALKGVYAVELARAARLGDLDRFVALNEKLAQAISNQATEEERSARLKTSLAVDVAARRVGVSPEQIEPVVEALQRGGNLSAARAAVAGLRGSGVDVTEISALIDVLDARLTVLATRARGAVEGAREAARVGRMGVVESLIPRAPAPIDWTPEGPTGAPGTGLRSADDIVRQGRLGTAATAAERARLLASVQGGTEAQVLQRRLDEIQAEKQAKLAGGLLTPAQQENVELDAELKTKEAIAETGRRLQEQEAARAGILTQIAGLTASETTQLQLQAIEAEKRATLANARLTDEEKAVALLEAQVQTANILREHMESVDPAAGMGKAFRELGDEWGAAGRRMEEATRTTFDRMAEVGPDLFFAAIEDRAADVPKLFEQMGKDALRAFLSEFSKLAWSPVLTQLRQAMTGVAGGALPGNFPEAGGMILAAGAPSGGFAGVAGAAAAGVMGIDVTGLSAGAYARLQQAGYRLVGTATGGTIAVPTAKVPTGGSPFGGGGLDVFSSMSRGVGNWLRSPLADTAFGRMLGMTPTAAAQWDTGSLAAAELARGGTLEASIGSAGIFAGTAWDTGSLAAQQMAAAGTVEASIGGAGAGAGGQAAGMSVGQALGIAGGVAAFGYSMYGAYASGDPESGAISGAMSGMMLGTAIYPGIGTVVGLLVGAALGAAMGGAGSDKAEADELAAKRAQQRQRTAETTLNAMGQAIQEAANAAYSWEEFVQMLQEKTVGDDRPVGGILERIVTLNLSGSLNRPPWNWAPDEDYRVLLGLWQPRVDHTDFNQGRVNSVGELCAAATTEQMINFMDDVLRIVKFMKEKAKQVQAARAKVFGLYEEPLGYGGITRTTEVSAARPRELEGRQLGILAESLLGLDDDLKERFLRELLQLDYDRDLRILRRDPEADIIVSQTSWVPK